MFKHTKTLKPAVRRKLLYVLAVIFFLGAAIDGFHFAFTGGGRFPVALVLCLLAGSGLARLAAKVEPGR